MTIVGDIFIVDDNVNNLHLLEGILREHQYRVRMAPNGKRALLAINAAPPELIMLDITMPDMDGYEVCQALKTNPKVSSIPVIFTSALDDVLDKVKAFKVGGVDYITKPFQTEEVIARIENQLAISRLRKELEKRNEELAKEKEALIRAQKRTELVFSALAEALPGVVLDNKYRLDKKIGVGGFGVVYEATQLNLNRLIAVKVFRPVEGNDSDEALERFRLEGMSACKINHPNSVSIIDFGVSSTGIAYLAMELLEGYTLESEILQNKTISLNRCIEILVPVCNLLVEAHKLGIIHRDIKPDNIFIHQSKDGEVIKVLDFGIAKIFGETFEPNLQNLTVDGSLLGTPVYMAPERIQNNSYDGRADIYSLGIVFYKMLCGEVPFKSTSSVFEIMGMHLNKLPRPPRELNPNISIEMETIVLKMLQKNPDNRFTSEDLLREFSKLFSIQLKRTGGYSIIKTDSSLNKITPTNKSSSEKETIKSFPSVDS